MRYAFAYVTGGGVMLNVTVPISIINRIATINTTKLKIALRTPTGGYLIGDQVDVTNNIIQQGLNAQGIYYVVKLDSAVTNNTPYIGGVWITCTFS